MQDAVILEKVVDTKLSVVRRLQSLRNIICRCSELLVVPEYGRNGEVMLITLHNYC